MTAVALATARVAARLAAQGGRPLRFAASELARSAWLGPHGVGQARRARAAAPDAAVRRRLYRRFWDDAASAEGAEVVDAGDGVLRLVRGGAHVHVWDNLVPLDHPVALQVASSRTRAHAGLAAAGVRVPSYDVVALADRAGLDRLARDGRPRVVKPAAGTGAGAGVTCGATSAAELQAAAAVAGRWSPSVVVEEQVLGVEHRVLVLDGAVLGAVRREPPVVVGDGRATVAELVVRENAQRRAAAGDRGLFPLTLDLDAVLTLRRGGRSPRTVPAAGAVVQVKTAVNEAGPAQTIGLEQPPDDVAGTALRAVAAVGLRLGAAEVVTPDDGGAPVVLEVNATPGLHYHYLVAEDSVQTPVCRPLLRTLLATEETP